MNADAVIVGLGNPGPRYAFTRHNIGFICLDILAQDFKSKWTSAQSGLGRTLNSEITRISDWNGKSVVLLKPQTFMNLSGQSVAKLYQEHSHLRSVPLIVVHDEVDVPFGKIRAKLGGGDAGHNGLKSIRACLGHGDFYRVRLGVGRPAADSPMELADFVLQAFDKDEQDVLFKECTQGFEVIHPLISGDLQKALVAASKQAS